jgi:hypothetical protein
MTSDTDVTDVGGAGKYTHNADGVSPMYWLVSAVTGAPPSRAYAAM